VSDIERAYVWDHSPYKGTEKLIHLKLADWANDTHQRRLWCGDSSLAEKCSCDERTIRRFKSRAIADGFLEEIGRNPETGFKEYRFLMPALESPDISSGGLDRTFHPGDRTFDPAAPDISSIAPLVNQKGTKEPNRASEPSFEAQFDFAWQRYPRRLNRQGALSAYIARRRAGVSESDLLGAVDNYALCVRGKSAEHIMHGATFFGPHERYRDYINGNPEPGAGGQVALVDSVIDRLPVSANVGTPLEVGVG
jgi:hypothetical protein